jgi:NAD(P)-dependent dehydrogenase (short-subunit alcohol dehydrogenase family)
MEIEGKTCIVTGGSRGIGRALAELLARMGARVAISGRNADTLLEAEDRLRGLGGAVIAVPGDVGRDADARELVERARAELGEVDVLVNNAAILSPRMRVVDTPAATWEEVLRVNVVGSANMIRHVLPGMERRGSGVIINLSSGWGREASGWVAPYCASKFAVEALTQSVAEETAAGIVVFALNPGVIATDMLATAFKEDVASYPSPGKLDSRWKKLFAGLGPSWHGSSRDL